MVVKTTTIEANPRAAKIPRPGKPSSSRKAIRNLQKQQEQVESAEEKSILVAKELKFVKTLAGNDTKLRRKVLRNLKTWLTTRSQSTFAFTDTDFLRLWKGLFYCMWMSDKPLVQEELADEIASLVKCFESLPVALQYFGTFLETMCNEWYGIDHWRIDKFMMLVRRCTRQMLIKLHEADWPKEAVTTLMKHVENTILNTDKSPFGLTKHFDDLLLEEIAKVSEGEIDAEVVHIITRTYAVRLLSTNDMRLIKHITSSIFHSLLYQSELGQDYQEKFDLWKKTNFVTGNIDDVDFDVNYEYDEEEDNGANAEEGEADSDEDGDGEEKAYDPRAGQVDVVINEIKFDPLTIVDAFESNRFKSFVTSKGKKQMKMLVKQYKKFSTGMFPLGIQSMDSIAKKDYDVDIDEQIEELENYQKELFGEKVSKKKKAKESAESPKPKQQKLSEKPNESNVWTESEEPAEEPVKKSDDEKAAKKKKKKRPSKAQLKEQKLQLLRVKREAKIAAIKEKKLQSKKSIEPIETPTPQKQVEQPTKEAPVQSEQTTPKSSKQKATFEVKDEWSEPLKEGETEMFIPSRKQKLKEVNKQLKQQQQQEEAPAEVAAVPAAKIVKNPFATPKNTAKALKRVLVAPHTDDVTSKKKRVKIALNKNISQDLHQHIQQVKSSPQLPYDSSKKPSKGALKPNLMPSPINPFYRKKIGLKLNDTM